MTEVKILTEFQADALKEVGNIGIGHATTSLSQFVNKRVWITFPDLKLLPLVTIPALIQNSDPVVGVVLELKGDAKGYLLLLLSKRTAKTLVKYVMGDADETKPFDEMEMSVLKETGNIMGGTYVSSLSNFLGLSIGLSTPSEVYDMSDAILNQIVGLMSNDVEDALYLKTDFTLNDEKIDGKILIFTDSASLTKLLGAINKLLS